VYVVGHYDPFVQADVRVLFRQPQPTIRDFSSIDIRVHFAINNRPEDVRPVLGANGYEIRAVSRGLSAGSTGDRIGLHVPSWSIYRHTPPNPLML
jgi:hypothetical protein